MATRGRGCTSTMRVADFGQDADLDRSQHDAALEAPRSPTRSDAPIGEHVLPRRGSTCRNRTV